jgi:predicted nucleic acid-binding protein
MSPEAREMESHCTIANRQSALERERICGVAVYDSLFVELAYREGLPLATFNSTIRQRFPDVAKRPKELLSR